MGATAHETSILGVLQPGLVRWTNRGRLGMVPP